MRLDRLLCEMNKGARSRVKEYIRQGLVTVDGVVVRDPGRRVGDGECVTLQGEEVIFKKYEYYMLNKPGGVVSATRDNVSQTVLELLPKGRRQGLFPVGRLDKDTEGLLLVTNDGELAHRLLSPGRHVDKVYLAGLVKPLEEARIRCLEQGVDIGEEKPTLPARVEILEPALIRLTIHEGKYHQVKRMLQAVGNEVLTLKRIGFGGLALDPSLAPGESRELTEEEVTRLHES